jgi:hypothetical protein
MLEKQPLRARVNVELSTIGERLDKTYRQILKVGFEKKRHIQAPHNESNDGRAW